jgi:protein CMS1
MSRTKQKAQKGRAPPKPQSDLAAKKLKNVQTKEHTSEEEVTKVAGNGPIHQQQADVPKETDDGDSSRASAEPSTNATNLKRDRNEFESDGEITSTAAPSSKKKKYKSKAERKGATAKPLDDADIGTGDDLDPEIAQMDPSLLADHVAKTIKRCYRKDTAIELDEKYLPSSIFTGTTAFKDDRKKDRLGKFLEFLVGGELSQLTSAAKETARPHTIILCQSGIRAADLARVLRTYETDGNAVVKLFAKHFKIEQQAVFLRKNKTGFGVGTPQRISELIKTGALKLDNLARIVIDGSHVDEKRFGIWGHQEVFKAMISLLKMEGVQHRIEAAATKVAVF